LKPHISTVIGLFKNPIFFLKIEKGPAGKGHHKLIREISGHN
jgi:hypothetical protein